MARHGRRYRRDASHDTGFWPWAKEHWFLTFLMGSTVAGGVASLLAGAGRGFQPAPPGSFETSSGPGAETVKKMPVGEALTAATELASSVGARMLMAGASARASLTGQGESAASRGLGVLRARHRKAHPPSRFARG